MTRLPRASHPPQSRIDESSAPLSVAYAAYHRTVPSERELSLGVARVRARLHGKRRRVRLGSLLTFAIVFVGAVAYAAGVLGEGSSGFQPLGDARPAERTSPAGAAARLDRTPTVATAQQLGVVAPAKPAAPTPASERGASDPPAARALPPVGKPAAGPRRTPPEPQHAAERGGGAWAVVAESMAAKDYARAEGALRELAKSESGDTRNNATLGLAQLALGRGDCIEARRLAARVLQSTPSPRARRRGEEMLARCAGN